MTIIALKIAPMTSILIIAHAPLASALAAVAAHAYPDCATVVQALDVQPGEGVEGIEGHARELMALHPENDHLILVDVFGATPGNAAMRLLDVPRTRIVAGVNVPMLWRTLCYGAAEPLDALVERAVAGATQGVLPMTLARPQNQTRRTHDQAPGNDQ
jgi:PTS system ascorbate-specific IIA component